MSAIGVPRFPLLGAPETWDDLTLCAATTFLEAAGEPDEGILAVAWVIRNRMDERHQGVKEVTLAPAQFSCWNADYRPMAEARLAGADGAESAWKAAAGALWRFVPDPTRGADHYLNPVLTKKIRKGAMPSWYDPTKITIQIGHHEFLKLRQ